MNQKKQPIILGIETSTDYLSLAVSDKKGEIYVSHELTPKQQSQMLFTELSKFLTKHNISVDNIDCLAVGLGPGSFTGIRVALSAVKGIAYAIEKPVIGLSSLEILAYQGMNQYRDSQSIFVAVDARMGEIYWAWFEKDNHGRLIRIEADQLNSPHYLQQYINNHCLQDEADRILAIGSGWSIENLYQTIQLKNAIIDSAAVPMACSAVRLIIENENQNSYCSAVELVPVYLRNNVAMTIQERKARSNESKSSN